MKITCIHCKLDFISPIVGTDKKSNEKALGEISTKFIKHLTDFHLDKSQQLAKDLMKLQAVAVWFITMAKHTTLLDEDYVPNEDFVQEAFSRAADQMEELIGVTVLDTTSKPISEEEAKELAESPEGKKFIEEVVKGEILSTSAPSPAETPSIS